MDVLSLKCRYTGEADQDRKPCGFGTRHGTGDTDAGFEGTWLNGKYHGIGELFQMRHKLIMISDLQ